jgi:Tol biopolymer transport system component
VNRKIFRLLCLLFLLAMLAACAKPTEVMTLTPPPMDTQVPATKTLPPPTDTPTLPTQTLEPSPTASSINEIPLTERVSVSNDGTQGNANAIGPSISADGRYVAFSSQADNLVEGDTNGEADIFFHDRKTGETSRVSVSSDGMQGNYRSGPGVAISADGRYVVFSSDATNLIDGDTNGVRDVFVHDQVTGETTRVSVASDGTQANNMSAITYCMCLYYSGLSFSADGRYVTFNSTATNLVEGDTDKGPKVFIHDRVTGETIRIPVPSDEPEEGEMSWDSSMSGDGRYVAFESWYPFDVFLYTRVTGSTTRVSESSDGVIGNSSSKEPSISADGRYVVFRSDASNLVEGDANGVEDIFVHDQVTGKTTRISVPNDVTQGNDGTGQGATISADGRYVVFTSWPSNWEEGNRVSDIFVYGMKTGKTQLVSIASDGTHGNGYSYLPSISADGCFLAFASNATNLVEGDTNGSYDIFVRDLCTSK